MTPERLIVLGPTSGPEVGVATREGVREALTRLAKEMRREDLLFVLLIGHGTFDGIDAKFNLVGPDLEAADWRALLAPVPAAGVRQCRGGELAIPDAAGRTTPGRHHRHRHAGAEVRDAFRRVFRRGVHRRRRRSRQGRSRLDWRSLHLRRARTQPLVRAARSALDRAGDARRHRRRRRQGSRARLDPTARWRAACSWIRDRTRLYRAIRPCPSSSAGAMRSRPTSKS